MSGFAWTPEEDEFLREHYAENFNEDLALALNRTVPAVHGRGGKLGLKKIKSFVAMLGSLSSNHPASRANQFKKGMTPANKGKKMPDAVKEKIQRTMFQPGHLPANTKTDGALSKRADGYWWIRLELGKWRQLHTHTWEQANRPINPKTEMVKFKDGNRDNCLLENLYLSDRRENMRANTIHRYPTELKQAIRTLHKLNRTINEKRHHGSTQSDD